MMASSWQDEVNLELMAARQAAAMNLEGRSRVCARRAAGRVVKELYRLQKAPEPTGNFLHLLRKFGNQSDLPSDLRLCVEHLCQRVNENHTLPDQINLIRDSERLIQFITSQIEDGKTIIK